ncbi:hypothetical protein CPBF424_01350 [Xanthomonas euroxanthea]|uniref:Secreted protein n=1 Tax=Xanthomonas euroxanthea TaxID=2259622 RepID=A0AA46H8V0_9XANT|nr:hypothetical protein CPBF424_01350 [Xanthomonas euroxanthea]
MTYLATLLLIFLTSSATAAVPKLGWSACLIRPAVGAIGLRFLKVRSLRFQRQCYRTQKPSVATVRRDVPLVSGAKNI